MTQQPLGKEKTVQYLSRLVTSMNKAINNIPEEEVVKELTEMRARIFELLK